MVSAAILERGRSAAPVVAAFLLLWATSLLLQHLANAYHGDLNVESDDPAHYVTGLMVHDYLQQGLPWPPSKFAQNYYAHYPKVAIGHWPPVFYLVQALWMLLFGASIGSDLVLMSFLNALFAATLYVVAQSRFKSKVAGFALSLLLICVSVVQVFTSTVMADLLVALFAQWAVIAWSRYWENARPFHIMAFALFASLAILTKGNGYALLVVPPICLLLGRRFGLLRDRWLWAAGGFIVLLCSPWSILTRDLVTSTMQYKLTPSFVFKAIGYYSALLNDQTGLAMTVFAVIGFIQVFFDLPRRRPVSGLCIGAAAWVIAFFTFHSMVPAGLEVRYLILIMPAWLILMANGIVFVAEKTRFTPWSLERRAVLLATITSVFFAVRVFGIAARPSSPYDELARTLARQPEYAKKVILVSSETDGEGVLVAEIAEWDRPRPRHIVMRAGRTLADSDWNEQNYHLNFHTPADVFAYLRSTPVGVLVMDRTVRIHPNLHQPLLEEMLRQFPEAWKLDRVYPVDTDVSRGVAVYHLVGYEAIPKGPIAIEVNGTLHLKILVSP